MTLATEVRKLTETKPFYAVAGASDLAMEKLRDLPEQLHRLQSRTPELRETAREYAARAEGYARDIPGLAKGYADRLTDRAGKLYDEFASRGRQVVSKNGGGPAELDTATTGTARKAPARRQAGTRRPRSASAPR
ncbi:hypothetical protein [Sinosporangium siamense]|uniref:Uncharacterized protein n=1 Tax=Sinosporangium siamense TaxID=1367973 RepID=A0A919V5T6_9ACTN|nr:hypothetical protein [Sinosporangium siamense]GII93360.1 hypothetical protein Ssi02_35910 [Sinosporangium siamense]